MVQKSKVKVGELLLAQGLITEVQLDRAVREQERTGLLTGKILVQRGFIKDDDLSGVLGKQLEINNEKKKLGEVLIAQEIITQEELQQALEKQKNTGEKLGTCLVKLGAITEMTLVEVLSSMLEIPQVKLDNFQIEGSAASLIPEEMAREHNIVPLYSRDNVLTVAMVDPGNFRAIDHIKFKTQMEVDPVMATLQEIHIAQDNIYGVDNDTLSSLLIDSDDELHTVEEEEEIEDLELSDEEGKQVVRIVNTLVNEAIAKGASDIHLEPQETFLQLRYRIDGVLKVNPPIPAKLMPQIISRIKILSKMDIAEKRKPLDGRFTVRHKGKEVDLRVSSFPSALRKRGTMEKIVMRILDPDSNKLPLDGMGFQDAMIKSFKRQINLPNGIVLVTGPTGSGKSTTLYACIREINSPETNIVTMEDPVELNLEGVTQGQINNDAGFTFAAGLRSILRQDPDVIMLGEMRDGETSSMAIEAALTGHLVFSTLHTNDSSGAFPRLLDMGLEPFLVASSIQGVLAQRLARRICSNCKTPADVPLEVRGRLNAPDGAEFFKGKGCEKCEHTGYRGRVGIFEFLVPNEKIRDLILKGEGADPIKVAAMDAGMITLRMDALHKAMNGLTTVEEIFQCSQSDTDD